MVSPVKPGEGTEDQRLMEGFAVGGCCLIGSNARRKEEKVILFGARGKGQEGERGLGKLCFFNYSNYTFNSPKLCMLSMIVMLPTFLFMDITSGS